MGEFLKLLGRSARDVLLFMLVVVLLGAAALVLVDLGGGTWGGVGDRERHEVPTP